MAWRYYSGEPLADPSTYYGGFKAPKVTAWGPVERALSDRHGQWEAGRFSVTLGDTDREVRTWLAAATHVRDTELVARMVSAEGRAAAVRPAVLYRGPVADWRPTGDLQVDLDGADAVYALLGTGGQELQLPRRRITPLHHPGCPADLIGTPEPIIYGTVSGALSAVTPPVLDGDAARGAFVDGDGMQIFGWGDLPDPPPAPTGVTLTEVSVGSPGIDAGEGPSGSSTYYVFVTAVDADGHESDPDTFNTRDTGTLASVTISGTGKGIQVDWDGGSPEPAYYRAYLCWDYIGVRVNSMLQVAGSATTCTFDDAPVFGVNNDVATGAVVNPYSFYADYAVSAVVAGSETALSVRGHGKVEGYRRPTHVQWEEVTGATEYRIYRRPYDGAPWDRRWVVPVLGSPATLYFDDDLLDTGVEYITEGPTARGAVPVIYTGQEQVTGVAAAELWYRFLVASHAVKAIDAWYLEGYYTTGGSPDEAVVGGVLEDVATAGTDYLIPGYTGWSDRFGAPVYRDRGGRRFTEVFARGPKGDALAAGTATLTLNVQGIEDAADGTGTLIDAGGYAYVHFLVNFVLQDYQTGAWLDNPEWETGWAKVHGQRFHDVDTESALRLTGGYTVRGYIATLAAARDWLARWNQALDVRLGLNSDWQWEIHLLPDTVTTTDLARFEDGVDVLKGSLQITPDAAALATRQAYRWGYLFPEDRWGGESELVDATAETRHGRIDAPALDLELVGSGAQATDIATRVHARLLAIPTAVSWDTDLCGLRVDVGDIARLTHFAGVGATGWTDRLVQIDRVRVDPSTFVVTLTGQDVSAFVGGSP